jgi:hypothetical protein
VNSGGPVQDLDRLLMKLVDGELTPVEQLHLMALLRDDPAAREQYVKYLCLNSLLTWELSLGGKDPRGKADALGEPVARREAPEPPVLAPAPNGSAPGPRVLRVRARWAAAGAGLMLLLLGLGRWRNPDPRPVAIAAAEAGPVTGTIKEPRRQHSAGRGRRMAEGSMTSSITEPRAAGLAILTRAVDVLWDDGGPEIAAGSVLAEGVLRFRAGILQLEFYSGATVVLEGPAEIELKTIDRIVCRYGKLRALVPSRAHGFRVDSSSVDLVDLGTEFGMRVAPDRKAEVHVFDGKVELHKPNHKPGQEAPWELAQGNGLGIGLDGDITPLVADSPAFMTPLDLDARYRQESGRRYGEWVNYSRGRASDRRLVTCFSFEGDRRPGSRVLVSQSADRAKDGVIVGCEWVDGRWPGKGALEFKRSSDRVRINVPGEFKSLTLAAWVRIDAIEHRWNTLMLTDGFDRGETHWQIDHLGRLVLGIRNERALGPRDHWSLGQKNYTSPPVITPEKFGRWIHLATVYDHQARAVTHYVDGAAVWSEPVVGTILLRIGDAELGNWGVPAVGDPVPIRNLCGRMDEFALFREALSAEEVGGLYRRGT